MSSLIILKMVTRKNVFKRVGKKISSISKASPEKIAKYSERAAINLHKGGAKMAQAGVLLETGDYKGAAQAAHSGVKTVVGQKNINAIGKVVIGKKAVKGVNRGNRIAGRADTALTQIQNGNTEGAMKTAMGKKAWNKSQQPSAPGSSGDLLAKHVERAKYHSDQAHAVHAAITGRPGMDIGVRPRPV